MRRLCSMLISLFSATVVFAQSNDCTAFFTETLTAAEELCSEIERNQLCSANSALSFSLLSNPENVQTLASGEITEVTIIQSLRLVPLALETDEWGVGVMRIQANLPDDPSSQYVTFILLGGIQLENRGIPEEARQRLGGVLTQGANFRDFPSTEGAVIRGEVDRTEITLVGRSEDGAWLLVDDLDRYLWVHESLVNVQGDSSLLPVIAAQNPMPPQYDLMQSFHFDTSQASSCAGTPQGGLLIQTPNNAGLILLEVNGVVIILNGTSYLQIQDDQLEVNLIDGYAELHASDNARVVPAGTSSAISLDEQGIANDAPMVPTPYILTHLQDLPVNLLPNSIVIANPLSPNNISNAVTQAQRDAWTGTWIIRSYEPRPSGICPLTNRRIFFTNPWLLSFEGDGTLLMQFSDSTSISSYEPDETNIYIGSSSQANSSTNAAEGSDIWTFESEGSYTFDSFTTLTGASITDEFYQVGGNVVTDCRSTFQYVGRRLLP